MTLISFAFLYALIGGLSFMVFLDFLYGGPRDFQVAERTLFMTVPKYVFRAQRARHSGAQGAYRRSLQYSRRLHPEAHPIETGVRQSQQSRDGRRKHS